MEFMHDEQHLMTRFRDGDLAAFRRVFDTCYKSLCYFTEELTGDAEEGQQIAIDAFEKLFRKHTEFDTLSNIRAFLYVAARNSCLNYLRNLQRKKKREKEFSYFHEESFVELELLDTRVVQAIHAAVESLPEQCRRVVEMIYFEDMKHEEVAAALGITTSTVRNQKRRAIQLLREKLGRSQFLLLTLLVYGGWLQQVLSQPVSVK